MMSDEQVQEEENPPETAGEDAAVAPEAAEEETNAEPPPPSNIATLAGEIEILTEKRLSHLDRGKSLAYAARASGDTSEMLFALICENYLVPRSAIAGKYSSIISPGLVKLVASGVVYWPPAKEERYVFVYQNTLGNPLMKSLAKGGLGWSTEKTMKSFVRPMVNILLDLRDADMVHGCINPMNIFMVEGDDERLVLGDCLSAPPSLLQPRIFEPVERAQVDEIARGPGTKEDDLYAFGVTVAMLMRHRDPLEGVSDEDIVRQKIEQGSYAAVTGKDRFTGAILELLRGLLYDDRDQRWTLDEIESWLDGQRLSPKQSPKKLKASRPIHFNKQRYYRPILLAMDIQKNQSEAIQMIDGGALEQWVERSLEDNMTKNRLEEALEQARAPGRGPGYIDRMITRVSIALDPEAPIRFKGMSLHPEGIQYAFAQAFALKRDIMPYIEVINEQFVAIWIAAQQDVQVDVGNLISKFDSCRAFLRQKTMGYGMERCLYFLCPQSRCISEKLDEYYVRNPEDLMYAFEKISTKKNRPDSFIDRHIAAFLSVKDRRMIDPFFNELNSDEYHKKILANIKILATIQKRSRMEMFPGIASWIVDIMEPVLEHYHDRLLRQDLRTRIEKYRKAGNLVKIITVLDNSDLRQRDFINFKKAMKEYADLGDEHEELAYKMERPELFGRETGQDVAAIVSGLVAGIIILTFAFLHFTGGGFF